MNRWNRESEKVKKSNSSSKNKLKMKKKKKKIKGKKERNIRRSADKLSNIWWISHSRPPNVKRLKQAKTLLYFSAGKVHSLPINWLPTVCPKDNVTPPYLSLTCHSLLRFPAICFQHSRTINSSQKLCLSFTLWWTLFQNMPFEDNPLTWIFETN